MGGREGEGGGAGCCHVCSQPKLCQDPVRCAMHAMMLSNTVMCYVHRESALLGI